MHFFDIFDEQRYLADNEDVREAVAKGRQKSGLRHFTTYGSSEGRAVAGSNLDKFFAISSFETNPPPALVKRVHGTPDVQHFARLGKTLALDIEKTIHAAGIALPTNPKILDFGCGPGRVCRWLSKIYPDAIMTGCDIDSEAVQWAQEHLDGRFEVNGFEPPLRFGTNEFDLVYAISVFTHLPEDMQLRWLEELARIAKKFLILTVQGSQLIIPGPNGSKESKELVRPLMEHGFLYLTGNKTEGLPDFYQRAYHTAGYIYRTWSKFFDIRFVLKRGLNNHQDIVVCTTKIY